MPGTLTVETFEIRFRAPVSRDDTTFQKSKAKPMQLIAEGGSTPEGVLLIRKRALQFTEWSSDGL